MLFLANLMRAFSMCKGCEAATGSEHSLAITTDDRASDENTANATVLVRRVWTACAVTREYPKSLHRRFVHSTFQTRGDYTPTRATQCANVVWSD